MKRPSKNQLYIHVQVLQSGTTLVAVEKTLRREVLKLTSRGDGPFVLPYYPIINNHYDFLHCHKNGAKIVVDHAWEGFATSRGELVRISRQEKGQSLIEMIRGDYASITHNDLRIMVKITAEKTRAAKKRGIFVSGSYKGSFGGLLVNTSNERLALGTAALISTVIIGGFAFGLLKRDTFKPKSIADIMPEYSIPFIAPKHFETAPEALQKKYNRINPVRSVIDYYTSVAENLMGLEIGNKEVLFPSSILRSKEQHEAVAADIDQKRSEQATIQKNIGARGNAAMLAIPSVVGETMVGAMRRVIDKVGIMHEHYAMSLPSRREATAKFKIEPEYSFSNYKTGPVVNEAMAAFTGGLSSAFRPDSSEGQMYRESDALAKQAEIAQLHLKPAVREFSDPIRFLPGSTFATFLSEIDFQNLDERMKNISGGSYSVKPQPIKSILQAKTGNIPKELVEKFINQHKFQLQICYEQSLRRNDNATGTMEWKWTISSRGRVSGIELASSSLKDKKLELCIKAKMKNWQFPNPENGSVEISYPFVFSPNKG